MTGRMWYQRVMTDTSFVSGFFRLSMEQRRHLVFGDEPTARDTLDSGGWDPALSETWIENIVGPMALPLAMAPHFCINGEKRWVPMVTEEPSVVAAAANGARLAARNGGFTVEAGPAVATAQVQLVTDPTAAWEQIQKHREELLEHLAGLDPELASRGGGPFELEKGNCAEDELVLLIHIHTVDAMGANIANTLAEAAGTFLETLTGGEVIGRIVTNAYPKRLTRATAGFAVADLARAGRTGADVARRMLRLADWAQRDLLRAATHNKGILNGILAVCQATANDTRAVAAGAFSHACGPSGMRPLSSWRLLGDGSRLEGTLELPLPLGSVGGLTVKHPLVRQLLSACRIHTAARLCETTAACGLANHFAALWALASEGIQTGHMALHHRK